MRKFFALMILFLLTSFFFVSCGDDDDEENLTPNNKQNDKDTTNKQADKDTTNMQTDKDTTSKDPSKWSFAVSPQVQIQPNMNVYIYIDSIASDKVVYSWDFGDGKSEVWQGNAEFQNFFVHTYDTYGEYTITLSVNADGITSEHKETIKILPAPPTSIQENTAYEGVAPYTMVLDAEGVLYCDSVKWAILLADNNLTVQEDAVLVRAGDIADYTFDKAGLYLLYLMAYGPGASQEGVLMRTDTVRVVMSEDGFVPKNTIPADVYVGTLPYTHELTDGIINKDSVKWNIKRVEKNADQVWEVDMAELKYGEESYTFENPGEYRLYLSAFSLATSEWKEMRTDTVKVYASAPAVELDVKVKLEQEGQDYNVIGYVEGISGRNDIDSSSIYEVGITVSPKEEGIFPDITMGKVYSYTYVSMETLEHGFYAYLKNYSAGQYYMCAWIKYGEDIYVSDTMEFTIDGK